MVMRPSLNSASKASSLALKAEDQHSMGAHQIVGGGYSSAKADSVVVNVVKIARKARHEGTILARVFIIENEGFQGGIRCVMHQGIILKINTLHFRMPANKSLGLTPLSIAPNDLAGKMIKHNKIQQDQKAECGKRKHFHFLL